jgi:hypothetical protein
MAENRPINFLRMGTEEETSGKWALKKRWM